MSKQLAKLTKPLVNRIVGHGEEAVDQLLANPLNYRLHPDNQQRALAGAIDDIGFIRSVTVNRRTGRVVDGHLRVTLAARSGVATLPVEYVDLSEAEEAQALLSLDPIAAMAASDREKLDELMRTVQSDDERVQTMLAEMAEREGLDYGRELADKKDAEAQEASWQTLAERFIVPPFSVLDARQGYWQERKRAWIALGIKSELGRGENLQGLSDSIKDYCYNHNEFFARIGRGPLANGRGPARCYGQDLMKGENKKFANRLTQVAGNRPEDELDETSRKNLADQPASGTSIFDPVLCELVYRWFSPPSGAVLDPFAGGSVRGIVASLLGHSYTGIDLRPEQIEANEAQAREICKDKPPRWIVGDSRNIDSLLPEGEEYDLVFSCPPYFDLEVYSEDERDLSNAGGYGAFIEAYNDIITKAIARLKPNRFACFVVGDIRDKQGFYRNFVSDTIAAFEGAGAKLYNEAVLVTAVGSLPIRVGRQFQSGRKLGKTHQNVLVFYKGDPRKIREFGEVEAGEVTGQTPAAPVN